MSADWVIAAIALAITIAGLEWLWRSGEGLEPDRDDELDASGWGRG